ncbi:hypothetical protein ACFQFC_07280 [Amorphoplanes digitatis]|uniref:Uncharacterized protein n=1 Tax=Actinoplanes digitatis TaxID=1868 RepID=A0A7W7MR96_9ACTN|nr:hypothetical protein [Actinoplanes digitatis]MBB4764003.1 hypothetical protein [Actinoplanes digitatis]GID93823.1 hypothetical protein Adi01nite_32350 [Actinoplanes digitatis]
MISHRPRRLGPFLLAAAALGAFTGPGAALADGPGYGGTADALTVQWRPHAAAGDGLAVYALGFKGGSPVNLRVGAAAERTVVADAAGALRVLVVSAAATPAPAPTPDTTVLPVTDGSTDRLSSGTSVLAVGTTPAGAMRTLVGSVPPEQAGRGIQDLAWWAAAAAALGAVAFRYRRRGLATVTGVVERLRRRG